MKQFPTTQFEKGATILLKGEAPEILYGIKSGFVKGYDIDATGAEQLVWLGTKGDFFPVAWAFSLSPNVQYFFSAFSDVTLYKISREAFLKFLEQNHSALLEVTQRLVIRFGDAMRHLNATEKTKAEEKIAHTLYFLSLRFGHISDSKKNEREVDLPITHQDIANLLGLTRETVTTELKRLKDSGLIYYDKSRFVIYQDKLEELL
jgi:CRP-like cAMP-binding protein